MIMDKSKGETKAKGKAQDGVIAKNSATEAPATPALCIMQMSPNNFPDWEKKNTSYFAHVYGMFGQFFETKQRYRTPAPTRPTVRAARATPAVATSAATGVQTRRAAQSAAPSPAPPDDSSVSSSDSDHESSDGEGSTYDEYLQDAEYE